MTEPTSREKVYLERQGPAAWIWFNRPQIHNAFDDEVIVLLSQLIDQASADPEVRVIVLAGQGKSFSAGADLSWMRRAGEYTDEENTRDAMGLAAMIHALADSPKATCARVHGAALGGALGLISACDVAFACERAKFGFSEVKLGLIPAVIAPHVIRKIGPANARELFVTGERFPAARGERIGLINRVLPDEPALDAAISELVAQVQTSAPGAVAAAKKLVKVVTTRPASELDRYTAEAIASRRASEEGQEGLASFLEKRKPSWIEE